MKSKSLLSPMLGAIAPGFLFISLFLAVPTRATAAARLPHPQTSWQVNASMPVGEHGGAADSHGPAAYVAGGWSVSRTMVDTLYKYVPSTDTWSLLSQMPDKNGGASAVYYPPTNKLYVLGGYVPARRESPQDGRGFYVSARTRIYDIASGKWTNGASMPDGREFAASGYNPRNGKIYVVGGLDNFGLPRDTTWEYDPIGNRWTVKAPLPHAVARSGYGIANGHLYVAGGSDDTNTVVDFCWNYDVAADSWSACANLPFANAEQGRGVANGKLYLFGGGGVAPLAATVSYDPGTNSWSNESPLNFARSSMAGTAVRGTLVAAGGYRGGSSSRVTETLHVPALRPPICWSTHPPNDVGCF
jgi:N-acetylneuraminic acid mutarotase